MILTLIILQILNLVSSVELSDKLQSQLQSPNGLQKISEEMYLIIDGTKGSAFEVKSDGSLEKEVISRGKGPGQLEFLMHAYANYNYLVAASVSGKVVVLDRNADYKQKAMFIVNKRIYPPTNLFITENGEAFIGGRPVTKAGETVAIRSVDNSSQNYISPSNVMYIEKNLDSFQSTIPKVIDDTLYVIQTKKYLIEQYDISTYSKVAQIEPNKEITYFKHTLKPFTDFQNRKEFERIGRDSFIINFWKIDGKFFIVHKYEDEKGRVKPYLDVLKSNGHVVVNSLPLESACVSIAENELTSLYYDERNQKFYIKKYVFHI